MVITGAFMAEAAATVDNKLHVWGGVLSHFIVGPDRHANFVLILLLQHGSDADDRSVQLELIPPNDEQRLNVTLQLPEASMGAEIAFAWYPIQIGLPFDGRYVCLVTCGDAAISLPMVVQPAPTQQPS